MYLVAPLAGSVDRNALLTSSRRFLRVAPLAGSVDRNAAVASGYANVRRVAPLAGSVDRNYLLPRQRKPGARRSPRGERG